MAQPSAPIRRFIYLLIADGSDGHTLHKIDTWPLFAAGVCPEGPAAPPGSMVPAPLPCPAARFDCARGHQFLPLGGAVEKIVGVDSKRHTVIFDTRADSVRAGPDVHHLKWPGHDHAWAEAGGRLYHLGRDAGYEDQPCLDFEALTYDPRRDDWLWSLLPSPPSGNYSTPSIASFADAGGGGEIIRVSGDGRTCAFDTARGSWRREGDWMMPFCGRAQYVADYGLWFGFSDQEKSDLCAADLTADAMPALRHVWPDVDGLASHVGDWQYPAHLSYLGGGRFCITRFLRMGDSNGRLCNMAVVTALEATSAAGAGEIQMVRKASICYHRSEHNHDECWAF